MRWKQWPGAWASLPVRLQVERSIRRIYRKSPQAVSSGVITVEGGPAGQRRISYRVRGRKRSLSRSRKTQPQTWGDCEGCLQVTMPVDRAPPLTPTNSGVVFAVVAHADIMELKP